MSQIGDECYSTDRINAVCEQLAGFILNETSAHGQVTRRPSSVTPGAQAQAAPHRLPSFHIASCRLRREDCHHPTTPPGIELRYGGSPCPRQGNPRSPLPSPPFVSSCIISSTMYELRSSSDSMLLCLPD